MTDDAVCLFSPLFEQQGIVHGFSTRRGGVSRPPYDSLNLSPNVGDDPASVAGNLSRFGRRLGVDPGRIFTVSQIHGSRIITVGSGARPENIRNEKADGLVVALPGSGVGVRTADCVPILLATEDGRCVAAVHAGWRGLVRGVIASGVKALCRESGLSPAKLLAAIGPCIGPCCYEVGPDLAQAFSEQGLEACIERRGSLRADLRKGARLMLDREGLRPSHIDLIDRCTASCSDLFFSYRRDRGKGGRQLNVIATGPDQGRG